MPQEKFLNLLNDGFETCPLNGKIERCDEGIRLTLILPEPYVQSILDNPARSLVVHHEELTALVEQALASEDGN